MPQLIAPTPARVSGRYAIVVARFNDLITERLLAGTGHSSADAERSPAGTESATALSSDPAF